jgi:hypothetical protein
MTVTTIAFLPAAHTQPTPGETLTILLPLRTIAGLGSKGAGKLR